MTIFESLMQIKQTQERNIANSLFQLHFHKLATPKQLQEYYGWERPMEEAERQNLINDTLKRLKEEQFIYRFLLKEENNLHKLYGDTHCKTTINIANKYPEGDSTLTGGGTANVPETGSEQDAQDDRRSGDVSAKSNNRKGQTRGRGGKSLSGQTMARVSRGNA